MEGLNFIDLFCGVGGFRQALSSLGHSCVFSSDLDKDARETYQTNYGEMPVGDITKIEAHAIPTHEVLCGGFPCQPFSISGKMNGFGDARGTLLYEILRIARVHKPKVLFLENVKNYQSHAGGRTMETTLSLLKEAGYKP
jgi:DNA (cytosine-5)-methyltransferase 1